MYFELLRHLTISLKSVHANNKDLVWTIILLQPDGLELIFLKGTYGNKNVYELYLKKIPVKLLYCHKNKYNI